MDSDDAERLRDRNNNFPFKFIYGIIVQKKLFNFAEDLKKSDVQKDLSNINESRFKI